jgi:hypothetical protein
MKIEHGLYPPLFFGHFTFAPGFIFIGSSLGPQATFEKLENELKEVNNNAEALKKNFLELTELKHILRKTQVFFDEVRRLEPVFFVFSS